MLVYLEYILFCKKLTLNNFSIILLQQHGKLVEKPLAALSCTLASTTEVSCHTRVASYWPERPQSGIWLALQSLEGWSWSGWVILTKLWSLTPVYNIQQRGRKKIIQRLLLENEEFGFSEKRGTRMLRRIRRAGVCFSFEEEDVQ